MKYALILYYLMSSGMWFQIESPNWVYEDYGDCLQKAIYMDRGDDPDVVKTTFECKEVPE